MSKRKRSSDLSPLRQDDGTPSSNGEPPEKRKNPVKTGNSLGSTIDPSHEFLMPMVPGHSSRSLTSAINNTTLSDSDDDNNVASEEQLRLTASCRTMRNAVVGVITDIHTEIKKTGILNMIGLEDMLNNLYVCWKKYPSLFASVSRIMAPCSIDPDLSSPSEIKDFMEWWFHGLSSVLLFPEIKKCRMQLLNLLDIFFNCLCHGNPDVVKEAYNQLLYILDQLSDNLVPKIAVNQLHDRTRKFEIVYKVKSKYLEGLFDLIKILRGILPTVFYFHPLESQKLFNVLDKLKRNITTLSPWVIKCLLGVVAPSISFLTAKLVPVEIFLSKLLDELVLTSSQVTDPSIIGNLVKFCSLAKKNDLSITAISPEFSARVHNVLSNLIINAGFNALPSDEYRRGALKMYYELIHCKTKHDNVEGENLHQRNLSAFTGAFKTNVELQIGHPLLEEILFQELLEAYKFARKQHLFEMISEHPVADIEPCCDLTVDAYTHSTLWQKVCSDFDNMFRANGSASLSQTVTMTSVHQLKTSCRVLQLAGKVNKRLTEEVRLDNQTTHQNVFFVPDFCILTEKKMIKWINFASNAVSLYFSESNTDIKEINELTIMIAETIKTFHEGMFINVKLPAESNNILLGLVSIPWFQKYKHLLSQTNITFLSGARASTLDNLSILTKTKSLELMGMKMFSPWNDYVINVILDVIDVPSTSMDIELIFPVLDMISSFSWTLRLLPWKYLITFLHKLLNEIDWESDAKLRKAIALAIAKLPCFVSNWKMKEETSVQNKNEVSRLLVGPCEFCERRLTKNFKKGWISNSELIICLKLGLPLLRSKFHSAKTSLSKLIPVAKNHSDEFCTELIFQFTSIAAEGNTAVGSEIMRQMGVYFSVSRTKSLLLRNDCLRLEAVNVLFSTLKCYLQKSYNETKSVRFSTRVLVILRELARNSNGDNMLTVEILKFALRLVMHRDSNIRNMLSQSLCGVLATKMHCQPWELMIKLRLELSTSIITQMVDEFCDFAEDSQETQSERIHAFLNSIATMGEFRTTTIFIHHYYPSLLGEVVPYLANSERHLFLLKVMSEFASTSIPQLLQDGFHVFYRVLSVGSFTKQNFTSCFQFLRDKFKLDLKFLAINVMQSTLNEMVCYLNERKDKVLKYIPPLFQRGSEDFVAVSTTRSEIQDLLYGHLMGIFVFVDTKLHSRLENVSTKRRILESFTVLIDLMGKTKITHNRSKVYATLNSLFSLGPEFYDLLFESWKCFSMSLEGAALGQMVVQILSAVVTLADHLPQQVQNLISYFIHTKKELTEPHYSELYFVLNYTDDVTVQNLISHRLKEISCVYWPTYFELFVKESCQENAHIRNKAIVKLNKVISEEHAQFQKFILDEENPLLSRMLKSFFNASRDADSKLLMILAESLGIIGAVDPYRLKAPSDEDLLRKSAPVLTVDGANFAVKYLDLLIREFQESDDTTDFDYCACLIQQLLQHFKVSKNDDDLVWYSLSRSSRELVEPLLVSKYKVEKAIPKVQVVTPIYLSDNGKTFDQWLSNWLTLMAKSIPPGSSSHELFQFSKYMVPRNNRIASFLLPYVATYAVIEGDLDQKLDIVKEIETILQKWIDQDKLKMNSQILLPAKETDTDLGTPEQVPVLLLNEDVIQYRCTQEVFGVYDHLYRVVRQAKRQAGLQKCNLVQTRSRPSNLCNPIISPCFTEESADTISRILLALPMKTVSLVGFHCKDFERALFYLEQDLKRFPDKIQDELTYLQQLYVSLNDMDSVVGVSVVRKREPTMSEIVCENFAKGKVEAGVRRLELMVFAQPDDLIATNGLLQAYLSLDEPRKAETLIRGSVSRNPHWQVALEEFQLEAAWKLRDWNAIRVSDIMTGLDTSSHRQDEGISNILESQTSWNVIIIKILSSVQALNFDIALKLSAEARKNLMAPIAASASDTNSYGRGYSTIVQLHILKEVDQIIQLVKESTLNPVDNKIATLIDDWILREKMMLRTQKYVDPVLNVRKSLLEILKDVVKPGGQTLESINGCIRDCWLTATRVESKAGNFARAYNCIVEAKKYSSAKVMIAHAKLLARKGDKEQAIDIINSSIDNYFPQLQEWKQCSVSEGGLNESPQYSNNMIQERRLCSQALLLSAELYDELRRLDMEKNVQNFENCIRVFKSSEKNYFTLAGYFDKIFCNADDKKNQSGTQEKIVKFYSMSLRHGCKYVYQSLPRLLSIWFDYASLGPSNTETSKASPPLADWSRSFQNMQTSIKNMVKEVPTYILLTAYSQLVSRLCHEEQQVWKLLKTILCSILCTHPHQALWMTMAVSKSSFDLRRRRCIEIYKSAETGKSELRKIINDYTTLSDRFIELCMKEAEPKTVSKFSLDKFCKSLPKLIQSSSFGNVLIPFQVFMNLSLPPNGTGHKDYNAFPQKGVFIKGIEDQIDVMHSLVRPKKVTLIGSDGKKYGLLCKAKDDLRKDCKVMEVNNVINWYLHRNSESRQRQLNVRIYAVTPINDEHGLLEWLPNLSGLRGCILSLYKDRGITVSMKELKNLILPSDNLNVKRQKFLTKFLKPFPAVFSEWFLNNFNDPQSWYKARMCYVRTAAVMSIVGFLLGLGDRHGENILMDAATGDIVHVDFNCIFNKGETFDCPERVPFRLTQNMVEAMGPLGVEGVFRSSCEITMKQIRQHKDVFMSVIRPFVFDPLVEWGHQGSSSRAYSANSIASSVQSSNKAVEHIKHIHNRIIGSARNFTKEVNTELSVEAQVAYLIDEARSIDNLCRMFIGWTAFI